MILVQGMSIPCISFHIFIFIGVVCELNMGGVGLMLYMISLDVALSLSGPEESGCMKDVVMRGLREVDVLSQVFGRVCVVGVDCVCFNYFVSNRFDICDIFYFPYC